MKNKKRLSLIPIFLLCMVVLTACSTQSVSLPSPAPTSAVNTTPWASSTPSPTPSDTAAQTPKASSSATKQPTKAPTQKATATPTKKAMATPKPADTSATVYITDTGKKYHRSGCRYLKDSKHAISLEKAKQNGYSPCSVCNP